MDDFPTLQSSITSSLVATTRAAGQLASEDLPFHRSLSTTLGTQLDRQNARLLTLADRLLGSTTQTSAADNARPRLSDIEAVEGNWRGVVDVLDSLLERADTALDEFTGAVRRLSPGAAEEAGKAAEKAGKTGKIAANFRNQEMEKPQLRFEHVPKNDETGVFMPLLEGKPHAKKSLKERQSTEHPYRQEIEEYTYPDEVYTLAVPTMYHPFETTTATLVDTEEAMYEMLDELKQEKELAIDLEHHDSRSYIGIVSLMQISTRDKDWIVDTLKPWRRKLNCLNQVFTDPHIIKVLHGAYMDVMWLQRDLGLYLIGLFDTHYACRALGYKGGSLAFLLKKFADVDAQKQYQMADWRIRPLPQELFDYARSDTHYLLYIFDNMRNELIERSNFATPNHEGDKLWDVLQRSSETALQTYEHPAYDVELGQGAAGWYKLLARTPALLSREQFAVFRAVHKWRDDVAREQDDSTHYVMPNHQIFSIAKALPMTKVELFNSAHPATQTLRLRVDELVDVIVRAKDSGSDGPEMMEVLSKVEPHFARKGAAAKEAQAHASAVVNFLPKAPENVAPSAGADGVSNASALPLRSSTSAFWGPAIAQRQPQGVSAAPAVSLTIPLPPLTAEIFADPPDVLSTPAKASESSSPEPERMETAPEEEDVFVLKDMRRKRKRPAREPPEAAEDGMAANADEVDLDPDSRPAKSRAKQMKKDAAHDESRRAKEERKKLKREAKAEKASGEDVLMQEEAPFDYNSAPSMLNPPRESREQLKARNSKRVDPYKKSSDVPKPLGRVQRERAGKSMTFKK